MRSAWLLMSGGRQEQEETVRQGERARWTWECRPCVADSTGLAIDQLEQGAPRHAVQLRKRRAPLASGLDQALGNEPAALVIAAVRHLPADLLQHDVHVRPGAIVELVHPRSPGSAVRDAIAPLDFRRVRLRS